MKDKWIFFDVGSTLVSEDSAHKVRFNRCYSEIRSAVGHDVDFEKDFLPLMHESGKNRKAPFGGALRAIGVHGLKTHYPSGHETVIPGVPELLSVLKEKYNLGVIANQNAGLEEKLGKFWLLEYFDRVFGSDDVGISKPDPALYLLALEKTGAAPENCVMVGDRCDNDVAPAKSVGMHTVRVLFGYFSGVTENGEPEIADATIGEISDLPAALDKIFG